MYLNARLLKLERDRTATTPDGRRRCRVCGDGTTLASVARFEACPTWGSHGPSASTCSACGRVCAEDVVVYGIDPDLL